MELALSEAFNKAVVTALYEALSSGDVAAIEMILAPDLDWWFHGPPPHQFLMRLLTGQIGNTTFRFVPHSVSAFGSVVLVEGINQSRCIAWVHAWTVAHGIITQVREYFNTSLTVKRIEKTDRSDCSGITTSSPRWPASIWESSLPNRVGKSVPGLVLAL